MPSKQHAARRFLAELERSGALCVGRHAVQIDRAPTPRNGSSSNDGDITGLPQRSLCVLRGFRHHTCPGSQVPKRAVAIGDGNLER